MNAAPVGDDDTVELPFAFENIVQKILVGAVVLALIEIVATHHRHGFRVFHRSVEAWEIYLVEGAVGDNGIDIIAILLVVVECEMLHAGSNALRLHGIDVRHDHRRGEERVFAHILEVASAKRCAVDVDAGTENH